MTMTKWLIAIPLVMASTLATTPATASVIRDEAGMFSQQAVEKAQAELDRLEKMTHIPVVIETIEAIPDLPKNASKSQREEAINKLAVRRDRELHDEGIYILISKRDHVISNVLIRERLARVLPPEKRDAIRDAFIEEFKKKDFDGGLLRAVQTIERSLEGTSVGSKRAQAPVAPIRQRAGGNQGGSSTMWTLLLIGLGIFAVFIVLKLLGGLFGRSQSAGYPSQMGMGRPGMGPGPGGAGPGYFGGGGYGGRGGGGFFSGLLGGLGGAMAGNWLYDQMSGRHGTSSAGAGFPADDPSAGIPDQGGDAIIGADDHGGRGASWDDGGDNAGGGGDWGGGDAGGDWGGGGGGGDWGGGDGGGDWGGGGGDGGGDW